MNLAGGALGAVSHACSQGELSAEPWQHQGQPCSPSCPQMCDSILPAPQRPCPELGARAAPGTSGFLITQGLRAAGHGSVCQKGTWQHQHCLTQPAQTASGAAELREQPWISHRQFLPQTWPPCSHCPETLRQLPGRVETNFLNSQLGREGITQQKLDLRVTQLSKPFIPCPPGQLKALLLQELLGN